MIFTDKAEQECKDKTKGPADVCLINDATTPSPEEEESMFRMNYEDEDNEPDKKSQSQKDDNPTDGAMDNDGKPTRRNNIPLLTGSVQVGLLYDAKYDRPLYGDYLWPPAKNAKDPKKPQIIEANVSHSSMDFIFDESILDRLSLIDVDAELKLSFMAGMIKVIIFFDSE